MYLSPEAVDAILGCIRMYSQAGSTIGFDYHAFSPAMADAYGVRELRAFHHAHMPGEPLQFGIEEGKIGSFLGSRGFEILDHLTADDIERRHLTLRDGSRAGKVPALCSIVYAGVI
jgi:O-methyltransferase involved in polyketide biosynthesis